MPDEGNKGNDHEAAPQTPIDTEPSNEAIASAQTHLTTSGAASLASASSVPPPLLSRPSIKSSASTTHSSDLSQDDKQAPSLLIDLADSTQRIRLSPSPGRPGSVTSNNTDVGSIELSLPDERDSLYKHLELGHEDTLDKDDVAARTQFLTKRLRSAIGEDLILREAQGVTSVGQVENIASSSAAKTSNSLGIPVAEASSEPSETINGETEGKGWGWSTLGNLPSTLRFDGAMNAMKRNDTVTTTTNEVTANPAESTRDGNKERSESFSLGSYVKPLDVRKWWSPAPSSSRSSSRERPNIAIKSNDLIGESNERSISKGKQVDIGTKRGKTSTEPASPLRGMPAGSFPSSSVAKRGKKKREQLLREAKGKEQVDESKSAPTSKEGPHIKEHNLEDHKFGVKAEDGDAYSEREYFVLSTAGKPIYVSYISKARLKRTAEIKRRGRSRQRGADQESLGIANEEDEESLAAKDRSLQDDEDQKAATSVGVLQALISNYETQGMEELQRKSLEILELPKGTRICYFLRPPLYLAATSRWGEDESTLTNHLEYLYLSILSLVSASKLNRLFDRAANFDLKRLLDGTDAILDNLLSDLQFAPSPLYDSLHPLRLDATLRANAGLALVPSKDKVRPQDALYALLVTQHGVVTLAKRKKKGIHPVDCHLLVNTVFATKAMKESGTQSWVPICMPKFAPQGYLYAHVSFLNNGAPHDDDIVEDEVREKQGVNLALVLVTSNPDGFEEMSAWRDNIIEKLQHQQLLAQLTDSISPGKARYSVSELRLPGLRHFIFKWRSNLQSTMPLFEDPYVDGSNDQKRLISLYGIAQECIYRRTALSKKDTKQSFKGNLPNTDESKIESSQGVITNDTPPSPIIKPKSVLADTKAASSPSIPSASNSSKIPTPSSALALKKKSPITGQHLLKTSSEIIFAWSTPSFEVYLAVGSHIPRNAIINIAKSIVKWIKEQESRLFIANPSIFE